MKGAKKEGCPTCPQGSPDEVGSHITRRFMVVKRPYYEHRNSPVRSKKKEGCQEEKTALKLGVRKDRPPGHGGPDAQRREPPVRSKKTDIRPGLGARSKDCFI